MDDEAEQTFEVESEKYNFDYYALSKLKKSERRKVIILVIIIILLSIALISILTLYLKSNCKNSENSSFSLLRAAKIKAYKKISQYGENCYGAVDCGKNAYCSYLQGTNRCQCKKGFMGNGIVDCLDIDFSIEFKNQTKEHIPTLKSLPFPKSNGVSICSWFKLRELPDDWKSLVMYATTDLQGEHDLMIWFKTKKITVSFRDANYDTGTISFDVNHWTHFCWTWSTKGHWKLYLNGGFYYGGFSNVLTFNEPFPKSTGTVFLGQDTDSGHLNDESQAFPGAITELFIYNKTLLERDVMNMYQSRPIPNDIIVGWWQFKGKANSSDIVEKTHPFFT